MPSSEDYLGSIDMWGTSWNPLDWVLCNGQLLQVQAESALFALIGTTFGGDGRVTFAVPNLQGRIPVGLSATDPNYNTIGLFGGQTQQTLTQANTPLASHTHAATMSVVIKTSDSPGQTNTPGGYYLASSPGGDGYTDSNETALASPSVNIQVTPCGNQGSAAPFSTLPPYLIINYILCISGVFPVNPN